MSCITPANTSHLTSSPLTTPSPHQQQTGANDRRSSDSGGRSHSTGMMQPLSFNRVHEDIAHPLSSLRSCSEFGLNGAHNARQHGIISEQKSSFWSRLFTFNFLTPEEEENDIFPVPSVDRSTNRSISSCSRLSLYSQPRALPSQRKRRKKPSVSEEINSALDFVFGFNGNKKPPREIELRDLKNPSAVAQLAVLREPTVYPELPIRRILSIQRLTPSSSESSSPRQSEDLINQRSIQQFNRWSVSDWSMYLTLLLEPYTLYLRNYCLEGDNELYYILQSQPFSSGIYLRGMLSAGLNNTLFHTYSIVTLPSFSSLTTAHHIALTLLVLHVVINLIGTPIRGMLHYRCWGTTRSLSPDAASQSLQNLIESDIWMLNRMMVWTLDIVCLLTLVFGQIFLMYDDGSHPLLSSLVLDMCATDVLSILIRVIVALIYFLSFIEDSDRTVLRKKAGLSNFDLDRMPTFVYTTKDEVENDECSICLTSFEMGEMLISLPCHQRHSFHANCIREWLVRQNVCPLCHKSC
jgi:hypothetical protein